jgi:hypothetical protein
MSQDTSITETDRSPLDGALEVPAPLEDFVEDRGLVAAEARARAERVSAVAAQGAKAMPVMRFLISESCYIEGAYHPCAPGSKVVIAVPVSVMGPEGPVPFPHVSLRWQPMDAAAQAAQIRVHAPQVNPMTGEVERALHGSRQIEEAWTGKPIVGMPPLVPDKDGKMVPVKQIDHEEAEAPLVRQPPLRTQDEEPLGR